MTSEKQIIGERVRERDETGEEGRTNTHTHTLPLLRQATQAYPSVFKGENVANFLSTIF